MGFKKGGKLEKITKFFVENYQWIFSGIGVLVLGRIFMLFKKRSNKVVDQKQKSGEGSTNIQVGGDVKLIKKNDD